MLNQSIAVALPSISSLTYFGAQQKFQKITYKTCPTVCLEIWQDVKHHRSYLISNDKRNEGNTGNTDRAVHGRFNTCITSNLTGVKLNRAHHPQINPCSKLSLCQKKMRIRVNACTSNGNELPQKQSSLKDFMEEIKTLGRIRIIVNTGVAVLESVTMMDNLFYHTLEGRGEYANVMDKGENVDFHLLLDKVKGAKLVQGKSKKNDTYMIRLMDEKGLPLLLFLSCGTRTQMVNMIMVKLRPFKTCKRSMVQIGRCQFWSGDFGNGNLKNPLHQDVLDTADMSPSPGRFSGVEDIVFGLP